MGGVSGSISEEAVTGCNGCKGGANLRGSKGGSGGEESGIKSTGIIQQRSTDNLYFFVLGRGG